MIYALRVFHAERKLLKTVMEVFIREPTIDWLKSAQQLNLYNNEMAEEDIDSQLSNRIDIADRKLSGHHPGVLMQEELADSIITQ